MSLKKNRTLDSFNLAFLDIMSCGLGAVMLIFMFVKFDHQADTFTDTENALKDELAQLSSASSNITDALNQVKEKQIIEKTTQETLSTELVKVQQDIQDAVAQISSQQDQVQEIKKKIESAPAKPKESPVEVKGSAQQQYLLGLVVEGANIGLLIDGSASMTDEKLIDIIKRKLDTPAQKKIGPKWQRTKRIVNWLINKIPRQSKFSLVMYNETAQPLGSNHTLSIGDQPALNSLQKALTDFVPEGATNLDQGLKTIATINPNITNLYIVTDGLPTKGSVSCAQGGTVSGNCRSRLFDNALRYGFKRNVPVNVVLLPLEGDPDAIGKYWAWSSLTNGLTISPALSWP